MVKNKSQLLNIILFSTLIVNLLIYIYEYYRFQQTEEFSNAFNLYSDIFSILIYIPAIWLTFLTSREYGINTIAGKVWLFMGIGFIFWNLGDFIWMIYDLVEQSPFPSIADVAYILGYPILYIAIQIQVREVKIPLKSSEKVIIGIVVIVILIIFTIFNIFPVVEMYQTGEQTLVGTVVGLLYPFLDIYLTPLAIILYLKFRGGQFARTWLYYTIGILIIIAADLIFAIFPDSDLIALIYDQLYTLSYVIFAISIYSILQTIRMKV